jgi:peptidoglycan hydrolase-like protein with peptidoglycan-binding domain
MLFPPYLDAGSEGAAVDWLQTMLYALGCVALPIERNGEYGQETVEAVRNLQYELGFTDVKDLDGNFGSATREALKQHKGIDVDAIPLPAGEISLRQTTWIGPQGAGIWPLH